MEGIAKARKNKVQFGAKPKLSSLQVQEMKEKRLAGKLIKELMEYSLSKASVYRLLQLKPVLECHD